MYDLLQKIGSEFCLPGKIRCYEGIKNGNINQTYKVTYTTLDGSEKSYIFQKVNTFVFHHPEEIMKNIDLVTSHIRSKCHDRPTLHYHHTANRKNYIFDADGNFWRVMNYVDSITFDTCSDLSVICSTGSAFGQFQTQLSDFDGAQLYETIADFHNTRKRLNTLFHDAVEDKAGRVAEVRKELEYIRLVADKASELSERYARKEFPVRVTHNDTKANNVLFDKTTLEPLVVVDLDTVMPGMAMYDFGDAVRFIANTAAEDEADLSKVSLDINQFTAFCDGYIDAVKEGLTEAELDNLVLGLFSVTIELASRFLDDYINGDVYFKINYPKHNLVRTRCQIHLAKDIWDKYDELCAIVTCFCKSRKE